MRRLRYYISNEEGSTAVEFALVGTAFILTLLFVLGAALVAYMNQALDNATVRASRQILIGGLQTQSTAATLASFKQSVCGYLPAAFSCNDVVVNLYVVPKAGQPSGYYAFVNKDMNGLAVPNLATGTGQFSLGGRGDYQYLQVIYPITFLPPQISSWLSGGATFNGKPAFLAISSAAFRNEQY
ncbi:TadE/TadG family type IV pilus assembly protein [Methylobacterium sp. R2-1]|uniref:TadE/TadG family type IV pilus assembly protein n=1 Tax=Methylobacterium sp. R2-1 TaxID=2587064 RepID=UPI001608028D|nr:TadE/TadG family type IV pilus assembly protein [Methylobacterium sp. R2-1]MBB2963236.1 Flp pilus assembly protein TadG [Methylobacterium sp. R2-1]